MFYDEGEDRLCGAFSRERVDSIIKLCDPTLAVELARLTASVFTRGHCWTTGFRTRRFLRSSGREHL